MIAEGTRLGIYRVGPELGRGGMGTVYRAKSEADGPAGPAGSVVALKVIHPGLVDDERSLERFRREAEIGKRIRHPNIVRTHDVDREEVAGNPVQYIVMQLVEGQTLASLVEELGTVPEQLRAVIADQALEGLEAIHASGVVHRDIKPENIVITPDHHVLLMDLGIARPLDHGQTLTQEGEFVGSLVYAAPEQFQPEERAIGPRSDLYAFGIVLFELATGKSPFPQHDLGSLLLQKVQEEIPPPRTVRADVDAFWNEVIVCATRRLPSERFASATEMRRVLKEGEASEWWRLRAKEAGPPVAERALRRLRLEREAPLVGRESALARLDGAWERARREGAVLLVSGPSGVGKSRLVYEFVERVAAAGGPAVAAGRCVGAGGRGYQAFVEALDDLLLPADDDPARRRAALEDRLRALLADTPGIVPQFADFLLGGLQPGVEGAFSKDALLASFTHVVERLAAQRPLILVVEDLHLAGAETLELFRHLARRVPGHALLLVGVFADDEVDEDSPLQTLLAFRGEAAPERLALGALDAAATEDLVRALVRSERTVRALARPLHEQGDGNALFVLEILSHLRAEGVLVAQGEALELTRPIEALDVPRSVRDLVGLRLGRLDEGQRQTLETAAILGYEFEAALLAAVLGQNRIHVLQRLAGLERRHRLVVGAGAKGYRFVSRAVFETVYAAIHPALRSEYHALVADTILASKAAAGPAAHDGPTAYALLRHLLLAGRARETEPFLETALDHVLRSFHASYAAPFLEKVAGALTEAPPATRLAVAMRLWTCYELLASRADQLRVLDVAGALATRLGEPGPRARIHALRAGSWWYAGDWERAAAEAREGLALARVAGDRRWEATCLHTLGAVGYRRGELEACAVDLRGALALRREIGDRRGVASTLQALGLVLKDTGADEEVLPALEEAHRIYHEIGERRGEAAVLMNIGTHHVGTDRVEEGLACFEKAIAGHRETGALLSEALALANAGQAHEILGRLEAARAAWARALALFVELGDPNGELAVRTMLGGALGAYGHAAEARTHLEAAIDLAGRKGARAKLAAAHRELGKLLHATGARAEGWSNFERSLSLDGEARSVSRVATLCEMGGAALAEGDAERAVRFLSEALPGARTSPVGLFVLVRCRLARAQLAAGRAAEASASAGEALERLRSVDGRVSPADGPEIYAALAETLGDTGRREEFLARARELTAARARRIQDDASRAHFLTRTSASLRIGTVGGWAP